MKQVTALFLLLLVINVHVEAGRRTSSSRSSTSPSSRGSSFVSKVKDKIGFGRRTPPASSSSNSQSSYPKQQWGAGGSGTSGSPSAGSLGSGQPASPIKPSIGGGGFVNPASAPQPSVSGGGFNPAVGGKPSIGGGGFVNPSSGGSGLGATVPKTNSNPLSNAGGLAGAGGLGALGGFAAGKATNQYSFPQVVSSFGKHSQGGKTFGAATPGYGTNWGTNFASGAGKYQAKKGFSKKALGLGVGAGFLGGAALGVAGTVATYSVYHRYQEFKNLMRLRGFGYSDDSYYSNYYLRNQCLGGCPFNSHCEWGFCECNYGLERRYGQCVQKISEIRPRPANFDPFVACTTESFCQVMDMNLICNTNLTVGEGGRCQCRADMKWNEQNSECQVFIDVDCSKITYDTPPAPVILEAVEKAKAESPFNVTEPALNRTETSEESLKNSLLTKIDATKASEKDLKEAFCRDIDSFSFDLNTDTGKPPKCPDVPPTACAIVFDSHDCTGGWELPVAEGSITFPYFSSYWKYRNDIDTVGVRGGCTLTAFTDTDYEGNTAVLKAEGQDTWFVLEDSDLYSHMENDIESMKCAC